MEITTMKTNRIKTIEINKKMIEKLNGTGDVRIISYENLMETANKIMVKFI